MKPSITIGRSSHCDIIVPDDRVSREHARISLVGGEYVYEDLSKNGSVIGGRVIHGRATVAPGAEILLAGRVPLPWAQVYSMLPLRGVRPFEGATVVGSCGSSGTYSQSTPSNTMEGIGIGYGILAFIIPLAGFIMYFVWKDSKPKCASQACVIAAISFVLNILGVFASL